MKILIASKNPVKIQAVQNGFACMMPGITIECEGISVPSGVADQPLSDEETLLGAQTRVENAFRERAGYDYYVGIEGGLEEKDGSMEVFAWVLVLSKDGIDSKARTASFVLPDRIAEHVREGKELGEADDIVFGRDNSKQSNGAVGILTNDAIDRTDYYTHAVILALVRYTKSEFYT